MAFFMSVIFLYSRFFQSYIIKLDLPGAIKRYFLFLFYSKEIIMNKRNRKIIDEQSRYLKKIVKDIKSLTKARKTPNGVNYCFSRKTRTEILTKNGEHYKPHLVKDVVNSLSKNNQASVMRKLYTEERKDKMMESAVVRKKYGRLYRIYGNAYTVKNSICKQLFKPDVVVKNNRTEWAQSWPAGAVLGIL